MSNENKDGSCSPLIHYQHDPLSAGPALKNLAADVITPIEQFYVRNHGNIPLIDPEAYRLSVTGLGRQSYSLADLTETFATVTLEATMQCAGNRRDTLSRVQPIDGEVPWLSNAIGNATWTGVRLCDVLQAVGIPSDAAHVAFAGLDDVNKEDMTFHYGGSIPLEKALGSEVLLAWAMNGKPLTPEHGAPLRVVVPGYIGARCIKWVSEIRLQARSSENYFQTRAYRLFPPEVQAAGVDWSTGVELGEIPINAAICTPEQGDTLAAGEAVVRGYAIAGGEESICRVEVAIDDGDWLPAEFIEEARPWTWRLWQIRLVLSSGAHEIAARATDSASNTQPDDPKRVWNFKGYMNNSQHRIRVSCA